MDSYINFFLVIFVTHLFPVYPFSINHKVFWCLQWLEKGCTETNGFNPFHTTGLKTEGKLWRKTLVFWRFHFLWKKTSSVEWIKDLKFHTKFGEDLSSKIFSTKAILTVSLWVNCKDGCRCKVWASFSHDNSPLFLFLMKKVWKDFKTAYDIA